MRSSVPSFVVKGSCRSIYLVEEYHVENVMIGNILHLCLPSLLLYTMTVRILNVIVTFYSEICDYRLCDLLAIIIIRLNWSADQFVGKTSKGLNST